LGGGVTRADKGVKKTKEVSEGKAKSAVGEGGECHLWGGVSNHVSDEKSPSQTRQRGKHFIE